MSTQKLRASTGAWISVAALLFELVHLDFQFQILSKELFEDLQGDCYLLSFQSEKPVVTINIFLSRIFKTAGSWNINH